MSPMNWKRHLVLMLSVVLILPACTTLRPVPVPEPASVAGQAPSVSSDVLRGDRVRVTLRSGETRRFTVTSVGRDALLGKGVSIAFADIEKLEVRKHSRGKSVAMGVVTVVTAVGVVLFAAVLATLSQQEE